MEQRVIGRSQLGGLASSRTGTDARKTRFCYVDERDVRDGRPVGYDIDGAAYGDMYWQLAQPGKQEKWLVTFDKQRGRVECGGVFWDGTPYEPFS